MFSGPWEILLILAIALLLFGSKKIRTLGSDLGAPRSEPKVRIFLLPKSSKAIARIKSISHGPENILLS